MGHGFIRSVVLCALFVSTSAHAETPTPSRERGADSDVSDDRTQRTLFTIPAVALAAASVSALFTSAVITAVERADEQTPGATSFGEAQRRELLRRTPIDAHVLALGMVFIAAACALAAIVLTILNFALPVQIRDIQALINRMRAW